MRMLTGVASRPDSAWGLPSSQTKLIPSIFVVLDQIVDSSPGILRMTVAPGIWVSMFGPFTRGLRKRSTTITLALALEGQLVAVGPVKDAQTTSTSISDTVLYLCVGSHRLIIGRTWRCGRLAPDGLRHFEDRHQ